jgi:hypothetical protein
VVKHVASIAMKEVGCAQSFIGQEMYVCSDYQVNNGGNFTGVMEHQDIPLIVRQHGDYESYPNPHRSGIMVRRLI